MGFALWIGRDLAWAQGTHEYRPMGAAVIAVTDLFAPRDFDPRRPAPSPREASFAGLFASLGEMNQYLRAERAMAAADRNRQRAIIAAESLPSLDRTGAGAFARRRYCRGATPAPNGGQ